MSPSITVATLHAQPRHTQLIDVRSPSEFASGHIQGQSTFPTDQIESRLADLSSTTPIVLICQMGKRARMTAGLLEPCQLQLSILEGGTSAWMQAGLPIVRSIKSRWALERQVRLGAGVLVLIGAILTLTVSSRWLFLAAFIGLGLTFAGLTDICPMAGILGRMPWNKTAHCKTLLPNPDLLRSRQLRRLQREQRCAARMSLCLSTLAGPSPPISTP